MNRTKKSVDGLTEDLKKLNPNGLDNYDSDEKLIIALDFGTTFSGIAFCFENQKETKIVSIMDWPGAEGESAPKIPTLINYDSNDPKSFQWGASVNRRNDNIVGVKLLLDPKQERPLYLPTINVKKDIKNLPKRPVDIAADFIGAIYQHALNEIGKTVPKNYMSLCQKQFVLSVPAVWSDTAKNATLQAAKMAGIFPVTLIKEPEAAALYTMHSLNFALNVGDAFVVCDAGGGTVDLISYEVTATTPSLQLSELVPGNGGMAGSLGLNQRFAEAVKSLVGEDQFFELRKTNGFWLAERGFDREVKKSFRGNPDEEYFINFPMADLEDDPENGLESNTWRMTGNDLKQVFGPLITNILQLIDDQVKSVKIKRPEKGVTGIFLVGGFGSSQYLKACVQQQYPNVQVMQPSDAWAAIVKGAALSKITKEASVVATQATKHYGVEAWGPVDSQLDRGQPSEKRLDGVVRCRQMTWYINIGDDILRDQKIRFSFVRHLDTDYDSSDLIFQDQLIDCSDPDPPRHMSKGRNIDVNCELTADLTDIDKSLIVRKVSGGKAYCQIMYDLVVTLESALMKFSLELDGKEMGVVTANFGGNN